ncbi:hypothetical protein [Jiella avicenniae]|uniref:Uncharacterized protein n=1 Tax=Jiella avicenniae TaxID=2907202 RepID=A0A9X1T4K9_9HYPH|nr:hypothetical protein [Jiella avicenniae]MCE7027849.1 hypothetical protein [Jiella avicenniae]
MSVTTAALPPRPEPPARLPGAMPDRPGAAPPQSADPAMSGGDRITGGLVDRTAATVGAAPATAFPGAANGVTGKIDEDYIEGLRATVQETLADYLAIRNFIALETLASQTSLLIVEGFGGVPVTSVPTPSAGTPAQAVTAAYLDKAG